MVTGLFGGTFDPLHNGHVSLVQAALASGEVDRMIVMPTGSPPHKKNQQVSMAGYRYDMAIQAFSGMPDVTVSDLEIRREGLSYTLDTIRLLQADLPTNTDLVLVYGSDILGEIEKWHQPAALMAACTLLVAKRGGQDNEEDKKKAEDLTRRFSARIRFFPAPAIDLSSSMIREAIELEKPYQQWLPERVVKTIRRHGIYNRQQVLSQLDSGLRDTLADLERKMWPLLDRKRLLHSLNVMVYSAHLATLYDVDLKKACVAALLHDCAKCLPKHELREYAKMAGDLSLLDPALAHGPAGAWMARTCFGVDDPDILKAIHYHTTGCAGMSNLDKIIFITDKVEPSRTYDNLDEIRQLAETDLDASLRICLNEIGCFLKREKLETHPYTLAAIRELDSVKS